MKEIKLCQRNKKSKNSDLVVIVDDEDFDKINAFKWHVKKTKDHFSARRWIVQGVAISMHRQIMGLSPDDERWVDHKDRNPLNNQKDNLRICTPRQNSFNRTPYGSSKYRGVFWHPKIKRWCVQIKIDGKAKHIGCFEKDKEDMAARCYDAKAKELHGEFANLNFKE